MKLFQASFLLSTAVIFVSAAPSFPIVKRDVDPSQVPDFGLQSGLNPTGTGDCDGIKNAAGVVVKVPCSCPPPRADFIKSLNENVAAGHAVNNPSVAVSFPTGNDKNSKIARINAALVTLQNLHGPGVGCPAASTTFVAQLQAIQNGPDTPAPASSAAGLAAQPSSNPTPKSSSGGVDPALVPEFGHQAGLNPTGTGDCDGITNAAGQVVKVPCSCPPDRNAFIQSLNANVAAGHAVNNPSVSVTFPTGNDKASQLARINAALVTLQNLHGPGVGCPAASTTFVAQQKAISG
jgi:hypothetical protein